MKKFICFLMFGLMFVSCANTKPVETSEVCDSTEVVCDSTEVVCDSIPVDSII